jgi:hypothetical protein
MMLFLITQNVEFGCIDWLRLQFNCELLINRVKKCPAR